MKTLRIRLSAGPPRVCPIRFCSGTGEVASRLAAAARDTTLFLVTDRNVYRHHGRRLERMLASGGVRFRSIVLPPGERNKIRRTRDMLEDTLIRAGADRNSVVAAFGGGVVGDIAGFAAATLFRGIRLIQVPTTLVSQVDSSIGGKVGIDHPLGKNLLGAFHQPEAILTNPGFLRTLPQKEYLHGMSEVIKVALILDRRLVQRLWRSVRPIRARNIALLSTVIARCCAHKGSVVAADEREAGYRRILNFGHTIGHAIEHASGYGISHGPAVSLGMAAEARISFELGMIGRGDLATILDLLKAYALPVTIPRTLSRSALLRAISFDKKKSDGVVRFTLLSNIGRGVHGIDVPRPILTDLLGR